MAKCQNDNIQSFPTLFEKLHINDVLFTMSTKMLLFRPIIIFAAAVGIPQEKPFLRTLIVKAANKLNN